MHGINATVEKPSNDTAQDLALLHTLSGADFSRKVEQIAKHGEFRPVAGERDIFATAANHAEDVTSCTSLNEWLSKTGIP